MYFFLGHPHTGDYLYQVISQAMDDVKAKTGAIICGVVTDNASNMENMRRKINDTNVFTYGCQAHVLNLVCVDLLADKGRSTASENVLTILTNNLALSSHHHLILTFSPPHMESEVGSRNFAMCMLWLPA